MCGVITKGKGKKLVSWSEDVRKEMEERPKNIKKQRNNVEKRK